MARNKKVLAVSMKPTNIEKVEELAERYGVAKSVIVERIVEDYKDNGKLFVPKEV